MPGRDGTGPNGEYENCQPKYDQEKPYTNRLSEDERSMMDSLYLMGRQLMELARGYLSDRRRPLENLEEGELESRIIGTGQGPCGNGLPRGGGRGLGRGRGRGRGMGRGRR